MLPILLQALAATPEHTPLYSPAMALLGIPGNAEVPPPDELVSRLRAAKINGLDAA